MQTAALQNQLATQEWLASKMEHVAIALDEHHAVVEELLAALTTMGWGFEAGLGTGLDSNGELGRVGALGEWGGIRATWEGG